MFSAPEPTARVLRVFWRIRRYSSLRTRVVPICVVFVLSLSSSNEEERVGMNGKV